MINNKKRVTLNRRASSLLLDYQAMLPNSNKDEVKEQMINSGSDTLTNEYTRQLVESALSLPSSVKISTKPANETITKLTAAATVSQQQQDNKLIQLPTRLKSSLRTPKSASAPCSPTTGLKSVQFSKNNLEDICLFRKAQTPLAISQRNIFWANEDEEEEDSSSSSSSSSSSEEESEPIKTLHYANWPTRLSDIIDKKTKVIRIEKSTIRLMTDLIVGKVLVRNIDYHKTVTIRYTFDFWETIDNVGARFHQQDDHKNNISSNNGGSGSNNSYDVFSFKIKLPPNATTLYFAVHYKVGAQEYWDNNDGRNYEVQIKTTPAKSNKKTKKKTKSIKKKEDSFIDQDHTKEDGLKARYDFSQSINLAKNNVFDINTGSSKLLHKRSNSSITNNKPKASSDNNSTSPISTPSANNITSISPTTNNSIIPSSLPASSSISSNASNASVAMPIPMRRRSSSSPTGLSCHSPLTSSPTFMDLNSQSYLELVNKYCFYSTSPSRSPMSING